MGNESSKQEAHANHSAPAPLDQSNKITNRSLRKAKSDHSTTPHKCDWLIGSFRVIAARVGYGRKSR